MDCPLNPEGAAFALSTLSLMVGAGVFRLLLAWARKLES